MVFKKLAPHIAKLILSCLLLAVPHEVNAWSIGSFISQSFSAAKTLAIGYIKVYAAYHIVSKILNYQIERSDTTTYPNVSKLSVYTDGKVTVKSHDEQSITVRHEYGASSRSDLAGIQFNELITPEGEKDVLQISGITEKRPIRIFERSIRDFFHLKPKKSLHHIISAPENTPLEITAFNSNVYTHNKDRLVHIDGISSDITIRATGGNVLIENNRLPNTIHIESAARAIINGFKGNLYASNVKELSATRDPLNITGHVFIDGIEQPYRTCTAYQTPAK